MILAGTHHTIAYGGISFVTILHAHIIAQFQTFTQSIKVVLVQIQTSFHIIFFSLSVK
jgi:hypothetical protein